MFELSLQYSLLSDHNVVNAALEALQQLFKTEFASVLKHLLRCKQSAHLLAVLKLRTVHICYTDICEFDGTYCYFGF